ncbi:PilZ domain-containing protein [Sphingomonas lacusdianchii]|uniref:PilZ domain-containing protein n=1 Tax=Sphingomonas lacusdianchii TaxID=2917992 RepID=UPI001F56E90F|nr:PilZ domain-containing protein [Sphingomonas sp. JXJ CY 53]
MDAAGLARSVIDAILPARFRPQPPMPAPVERRAAARKEAALSASVVTGGRTHRGQIRNISTTGLTLVFDSPPQLFKGAHLLVCAGALTPFTGSVRWIAGRECGMVFNSALAEEVVDDTSALFDPGKRVRPGRAKIHLVAAVSGPGLERRVTIENIGSGGAQLATGLSLPVDTGVMIHIDGMLPIGGHVRWSHAGRCGVMFNKLLPVAAGEEIARRCAVHSSWLDELREAHAAIVDEQAGSARTDRRLGLMIADK